MIDLIYNLDYIKQLLNIFCNYFLTEKLLHMKY